MLYEWSSRMTTSRGPDDPARTASGRVTNGRANARTISARAESLMTSSSQSRIRRRRIGRVRDPAQEHQRWEVDDLLPLARRQVDQDRHCECAEREKEQRCEKRHLPHLVEPLSGGQVSEEGEVQRAGRVEQGVIDAIRGESGAERRDVLTDQGSVLLRERRRHHRKLFPALEVLKARGLFEREIDFRRDRARGTRSDRCRGTGAASRRRGPLPGSRTSPK